MQTATATMPDTSSASTGRRYFGPFDKIKARENEERDALIRDFHTTRGATLRELATISGLSLKQLRRIASSKATGQDVAQVLTRSEHRALLAEYADDPAALEWLEGMAIDDRATKLAGARKLDRRRNGTTMARVPDNN